MKGAVINDIFFKPPGEIELINESASFFYWLCENHLVK